MGYIAIANKYYSSEGKKGKGGTMQIHTALSRSALVVAAVLAIVSLTWTVRASVPGADTVQLIPQQISVISDSSLPPEVQALEAQTVGFLFDRDTTTLHTAYAPAQAIAMLQSATEVRAIKFYGPAPYLVSVFVDQNGTWQAVAEVQNSDLSTLPAQWNAIAITPVTTAKVRFDLTPVAGTAFSGLKEIEIWGAGTRSNPQDGGTLLNLIAANGAPDYIKLYAATQSQGVIAATADDPSDNTFTVAVDRRASDFNRVLLVYDVFGLGQWPNAVRSINNNPLQGGWTLPLNDAWTTQIEAINPAWLNTGNNQIVFSSVATASYTIRNVRLLAVLENGADFIQAAADDQDLIDNDASRVADGDLATGWVPYPAAAASNVLTLTLAKPIQSDQLAFYLVNPLTGTLTLAVQQNGAWNAPGTPIDGSTFVSGWNSLPLTANAAISGVKLTFNGGAGSAAEIKELQVIGSGVGPRDSPTINLTYPDDGQFIDRRAYIRGFVSPVDNGSGRAQITIAGQTLTPPDGAFGVTVAKDDILQFKNQSNGEPWAVTIQASYPDGTVITKTVTLSDFSTASNPNGLLPDGTLPIPPKLLSLVSSNNSTATSSSPGDPTATNLSDGATVNGAGIQVIGTFEGPPNTGITVNGMVAQLFGNQFIVNNVPLTPGVNTLTVIATTLDGTTTTKTLTVNSNSAGPGGITVARAPPGSLVAIYTVAGTGIWGFAGDNGPAWQAQISNPNGIALNADGALYIADGGNNRIRKVDANGVITTVAGNGDYTYSGDNGPALQAGIGYAVGVTVGPEGSLYITDFDNNRIRKVDPSGIITTVAGNGNNDFTGDNGPALAASLNMPIAVAIDQDGSLYIADYGNNRIRKVDPNGIITTVAGSDNIALGDNGPAIQASLNSPVGIALGPDGSLYIADASDARIRKVDANGIITTVAGNGVWGYSGDGQPAMQAQLAFPTDVALGPDGSLYITDGDNNNIRKVNPQGIITTLAGSGSAGFSGDGGPPQQASLNFPTSIALSTDGTLYVDDAGNDRIRAFTTLDTTSPLLVGFKLTNNTGNTITKIAVDYEGTGITSTITNPGTPLLHYYTKPGIYTATFTVTDSTNTVYVVTYIVVIEDVGAKDQMLQAVYTDMLGRLKSGNIQKALNAVTGGVHDKYQNVFASLQSDLPQIVDQLGTIQGGVIGEEMAEYVLVRNQNGQSAAYLLYFIRSEDGVWRIDGM